jgi:hypothetical protein
MFSQETEEVIIALLTITHPSSAEVLRISSDPTELASVDPLMYGTQSRDYGYLFIPFQLVLPESSDDAPPSAKLVLTNVERELVPLIRSYHAPATVLIELILASSPNVVELSIADLQIVQCTYDVQEMQFSLGYPSLSTEPIPALSFTPNFFPGLFR